MSLDQIVELLKTYGLKITPQRVEILKFLDSNRIHPTAQQIYEHVLSRVGSVSFTTVYNTLHTLEQIGSVKRIAIDDSLTIYDIDTSNHGHFVCKVCGRIYDIPYEIKADLPGKAERTELIVYGVCRQCENYPQ
ncbi:MULTISPECIES: Fur family transcriptional regulator [Pseudothermotoga]|jgi:Fur family peroxide stress response transcriptional regulator|uniref:Ferric uptake regulator, Fur family n=1 Tax=Pseudothermotoga lettingae (strain ATCC BAA-301 / DSM 14385 / NBRC 107922 / TMO) TaxID=416591 RepID=A8F599_PSELT|nr:MULTISPECIES: Fur family transcriptional regulator [Pseudothermotoga]ABV33333.1 ferric uptake regulator, Fur family [Pseudothermotoga lettingae TMO]KUK20341.1 MAG: Ferric uptake regulator, Fur family [Pseudothermotoga lettingae]MDI3493979.1 Fur family transcriptional regulator, peroxide stress response regulator [Pseudothermotoga sp.]MDK2884495.1 Fur family transcriptional regulator, peroxide stress response regulator [Pseudothermotoga sp.]GLI49750.1 transcriptional repressor [Pseudothermot